jgi:hypothetical protein
VLWNPRKFQLTSRPQLGWASSVCSWAFVSAGRQTLERGTKRACQDLDCGGALP